VALWLFLYQRQPGRALPPRDHLRRRRHPASSLGSLRNTPFADRSSRISPGASQSLRLSSLSAFLFYDLPFSGPGAYFLAGHLLNRLDLCRSPLSGRQFDVPRLDSHYHRRQFIFFFGSQTPPMTSLYGAILNLGLLICSIAAFPFSSSKKRFKKVLDMLLFTIISSAKNKHRIPMPDFFKNLWNLANHVKISDTSDFSSVELARSSSYEPPSPPPPLPRPSWPRPMLQKSLWTHFLAMILCDLFRVHLESSLPISSHLDDFNIRAREDR